MRLRLKACDLLELAGIYRHSANEERRRAEDMRQSTQAYLFIEAAARKTARAEKLEALAKLGDEFLLVPAAPFNGGPPSLMVVGGTDAKDGSAFMPKKHRA